MAQGRMISRRVDKSKKVNATSDWAYRVWGQTMPFCDRDGFLPFDAVDLLAECFPRLQALGRCDEAAIERAREELFSVGLWRDRVDEDGVRFIEVVAMGENQSGEWRYDREPPTRFRVADAPLRKQSRNGSGTPPEGSRDDPGSDPATTRQRAGDLRRPLGRNLNLESEYESGRERRTRARTKSEDRAKEPVDNSVDIASSARAQEAQLVRPGILRDFRAAIDSPEWAPTGVDAKALTRAVQTLESLPGRVAAFRRAAAHVRADGRAHAHLFADVVQLLVVGLPAENGAHASPDPALDSFRADVERWEAMTEAEREAETAAVRKALAPIAPLVSRIGRPMPSATA